MKSKATVKAVLHVDPISNVVNSLSKAMDTIETVQNYMYSTSGNSWNHNQSGTLGVSNWGNSIGNGTWNAQQSVATAYPKIDIVKDTMDDPDGVKSSVPVYRVDIYVAGVPKDNLSVHLEEGNFVGTTYYPPKMNIKIEKQETSQNVAEEFFWKESKHSYTNRVINLPEDADVFNTTPAELVNGVLSFKLRKNATPKTPTKLVTINIK